MPKLVTMLPNALDMQHAPSAAGNGHRGEPHWILDALPGFLEGHPAGQFGARRREQVATVECAAYLAEAVTRLDGPNLGAVGAFEDL